MLLVDTNVPIYAAGTAHALKEASQRILTEVATGAIRANVDAEVLQEVLYVYGARNQRKKGFDTVDDLLVIFPNPIPIGREEIEEARDLMRQYNFLVARDAIHAAVVRVHRLDGIISADRAFDRVAGVKRSPIT